MRAAQQRDRVRVQRDRGAQRWVGISDLVAGWTDAPAGFNPERLRRRHYVEPGDHAEHGWLDRCLRGRRVHAVDPGHLGILRAVRHGSVVSCQLSVPITLSPCAPGLAPFETW